MYIKFVSDLDYSYNPKTRKFDIPSVEWDTDMGRFWESFDSEEARTKALDENQAYNEQPEVKAYIEAQEEAEDMWRADAYTEELFGWAMEQGHTVALSDAIAFAQYCSDTMRKRIAQLVCLHNKLIMKARVQPTPATFTLGDLF